MLKVNEEQALRFLKSGGVIAYPIEGMYAVGCDMTHRGAVEHLQCIKEREDSEGFIVLINNFQQLLSLVTLSPRFDLSHVMETWPGATTWRFPASSTAPKWITGRDNTVAIRMTAHPIAQTLCANGPIVSTSAALDNAKPAKTASAVNDLFGQLVDGIIDGPLGELSGATPIYDVLTKACIRPAVSPLSKNTMAVEPC